MTPQEGVIEIAKDIFSLFYSKEALLVLLGVMFFIVMISIIIKRTK